MRKVAVFFGGKSCEREISILTGAFVLNVLAGAEFDLLPVYVHTDGGFYTSRKAFDLDCFRKGNYSSFERIFFDGGAAYKFCGEKKIKRLGKVDGALNCCHGGLGEGGGVSAVMELNEIPLASPRLTASGVFMDKSLTKIVAKGLGVPTVEFVRVKENDYKKRGAFLLKTIAAKLKYPVIVKPATLGSSIGIGVARDEEEAKAAIETAFKLDDCLIVEKFVEGKKDVNCAAYSVNGEIFVSEPETAFGEKLYGFSEKYLADRGGLLEGERRKGGGRVEITGELRDKIRAYTKTIYRRMNLVGVVRMDYLVAGEEVYLGEVNTVPGSLAYYLFCERLVDARSFFSDLIKDALARGGGEKEIVSTGILSTVKLKRK